MSTTVQTDFAANYFQALNPGSFQQVTTSGSHAESLAMDDSTTIVKCFCTQDVWLAFGTAPVAASIAPGNKTNYILLRGGFASYFGIPKGKKYKISAVQDSTGGTLDILEGA